MRCFSSRTASQIRSDAFLQFSSLDKRPKVIRKLPSATLGSRPIASSTWLLVPELAAQALPVATKTPLVSGAAIRFEGQVSVFDTRDATCPCYNCLYPRDGSVAQNCSENGVIAPITGIIGSTQALETIKVLTGAGQSLQGRVLLLDALSMQWQSMQLPRNPNCPTCSNS